jgi:hypothetical protein
MNPRPRAFSAVLAVGQNSHLVRVYVEDDALYVIDGGASSLYKLAKNVQMAVPLGPVIAVSVVPALSPHHSGGIDWGEVAFAGLVGAVSGGACAAAGQALISRARREFDRTARLLDQTSLPALLSDRPGSFRITPGDLKARSAGKASCSFSLRDGRSVVLTYLDPAEGARSEAEISRVLGPASSAPAGVTPAAAGSRRLVVGLAIVAFVGVVAAGALSRLRPERWVTYAPDGAGCSFDMPEGAKENQQTVPSAAGEMKIRMWEAETRRRGYTFGLVELPFLPTEDRMTPMLEGSRDGALKNAKATLKSSHPITRFGHPGIEFEGTNDQLVIQSQVINVGQRNFMLVVAGTERMSDEETNRFFGAFKLAEL